MGLSDKQKYVLYNIVQGVKKDNILEQTLGGYAGTGKSTLLKYITQFLPDFGVCAYTGKAANVLRRKGMESAQTIHSLIYRPVMEYGKLIGFDLASREELGCQGFAVDEASMVSKDLYYDLKSYNLPIIFVGDHGQLEPIGTTFNIMAKPQYTLEEIHRNAGDIARFAEKLRFGFRPSFSDNSDKIQILNQKNLRVEDYLEYDQVICAFNKTRVNINRQIREAKGFTGTVAIGERVMCLKNNKKLGLFNGMQGYVRDLYEDDRTGRKLMDFEFDDFVYEGIWYDTRQFGQERPDTSDYIGRDNPNPFDYAHCITAHKAQGDEFPRVLVIEQKCNKWDHKRWAYTAGSRAREFLGWAA